MPDDIKHFGPASPDAPPLGDLGLAQIGPDPALAEPAAETAPVEMRALLHCGEARVRPELVIAIPVCNEEKRITACVDALAVAVGDRPGCGVVLMVNNSTDASVSVAQAALAARGMTGIIAEAVLAPRMATAGWARRLALDMAAQWAMPDAVLMTTDADARVAPGWAEANLALLADGAHLVCGAIAPDPAEASRLPERIRRSSAVEEAYTALSIELDARLDPRPHDPWPHHGRASGASLAIRAQDYRRLGGMPPLPCSEDRAFAALAERHDLRVRHSDAPLVTVSCRVTGRARGGMADAISARIADPDSLADDRLLPAAVTAYRAICRSALRTVWSEGGDLDDLLRALGVPVAQIARLCNSASFGALWADVEAGAHGLGAPRMRPSDLEREMPGLRALVAHARGTG